MGGPGGRVEQPGILWKARSVVPFPPSRTVVEPFASLGPRALYGDRAATGWRGDVTTGGVSYLDGRLQTRAYDDPDGVRRWATTIVVNRLQVLDHRRADQ